MTRALIDTTVLFAGVYRRDSNFDRGVEIINGIDDGTLPEVTVLEFVLAETLNGLGAAAGQQAAGDFLDRLEHHSRMHIERMTERAFATAQDRYPVTDELSFVDTCLVVFAELEGFDFLYAFDTGFDAIDTVHRLNIAVNPFEPDRDPR